MRRMVCVRRRILRKGGLLNFQLFLEDHVLQEGIWIGKLHSPYNGRRATSPPNNNLQYKSKNN